MCLAVPMKLCSRDGDIGLCDVDGVVLRVSLALTPEAKTGDYLIVHAGYALTIMDEQEAAETTNLLRELGSESS